MNQAQEITQQQAQTQTVVRDEHSDDTMGKTRTLYDASAFEIFWRNLFSGMARGLGSVIIWLMFILLMGYVFTSIIWPQVQPVFNDYRNLLNTFSSMQSGTQLPGDIKSYQFTAPGDEQIQDIMQQPAFQDIVDQIQNQ